MRDQSTFGTSGVSEPAVLPCQLGVRLREASQDGFPSPRDLGDLQRWGPECHAEVLSPSRALRSEDESVDPDSLSAGSPLRLRPRAPDRAAVRIGTRPRAHIGCLPRTRTRAGGRSAPRQDPCVERAHGAPVFRASHSDLIAWVADDQTGLRTIHWRRRSCERPARRRAEREEPSEERARFPEAMLNAPPASGYNSNNGRAGLWTKG